MTDLVRRSVPRLSVVPRRVRTGSQVNELINAIAQEVEQSRIEKIKASKAQSLLIDESADFSKQEQFTLNIIYAADGKKHSIFITLIPIKGQKSIEIFDAIIKYFSEIGVTFENLYAFGSDGAANIRGKEKGVAVKLKEHVDHPLITIHCVAHCSGLSVKTAVQSSSLAIIVDEVVRAIASDFSRSSNANAQFTHLQEIVNEFNIQNHAPNVVLRVVPYHEIRWLSRDQSIAKLLKLMPHLLTFYKIKTEDNHPRYEQLLQYKTLNFYTL